MATDELLMSGETARALGVSVTAVHDLIRRGELPVAVTTRTGWRLFRERDVQRLAAARQARGRPAPPDKAA